jgi:hypothetical protein
VAGYDHQIRNRPKKQQWNPKKKLKEVQVAQPLQIQDQNALPKEHPVVEAEDKINLPNPY